jgi:hypothetical protein
LNFVGRLEDRRPGKSSAAAARLLGLHTGRQRARLRMLRLRRQAAPSTLAPGTWPVFCNRRRCWHWTGPSAGSSGSRTGE